MGIFLFDENTSEEYGLLVCGKNIHSAPARDQTFISVPGRNGDVIIDNGRYENVNISYTCQCKDLIGNMEAVKAWLCRPGYFKLQDSYNVFYYRMASFSSNLKVDELMNNVGKFDINFSCKPFKYNIFGSYIRSMSNGANLKNSERFSSLPYIKIIGSGAVTLNINNRAYAFSSVPTYLQIDSELMSCYKGDTLHNDKINFTEFPYLEPGDNNISWTGNVSKVEILPRWRTL